MHVLLAKRQAAEAEVVEKINRATLSCQAKVVKLLSDWLWAIDAAEIEPGERTIIEEKTGANLAEWSKLRQTLKQASKPADGFVQEVGLATQREVTKQAMSRFMQDLVTKVLKDVPAISATRVGAEIVTAMHLLNATIEALQAEHLASERDALATLQARTDELLRAVSGGA